MLKGNKGEWSELYVLIKLIAEGKLYQSDMNLEKDYNNVYEVIKAYKNELNNSLEFVRNNGIEVKQQKSNIVKFYTEQDFEKQSNLLFLGIKNGKGNSFSIPNLQSFLDECNISKIKAASSSKADIALRIYDHRLAKETDLGFSVKSLLGGKSTLFNPGSGNNFIYAVTGQKDLDVIEFNKQTYAPQKKQSKIWYRLRRLEENGFLVKFQDIQSKQLWRNLKMVDGDLPEILGYALYFRWINRTNSLKKVTQYLEDIDPLDFYSGEPSSQKLYEYKIKKFLVECAMGMTSEKPWHGEYDSFGGVIVAKEDGDVVCFHIYDFNLFRNYLLNNTFFEQPSTGEDEFNPGTASKVTKKKFYFGWLYEDNNNLFFKINLQIRFS
ncbi:HpaII family restriction endonuclease [Sphingobacterium sp. Lzh-3]|uniref:HpaII family restriction endonuclease n=1 Tax=Sphingobacterium sp. Lzh-3 TaxID=3382150 RepID=UPI00398CF96C